MKKIALVLITSFLVVTTVKSQDMEDLEKEKIEYTIKIDGIEGDNNKMAKGEIDVESWSFGAYQKEDTVKGKYNTEAQELYLSTKLSKASPVFYKRCKEMTPIKQAVLIGRRNNKEVIKVTLDNVLVTSYQTGGSSGSDYGPMDQVSIHAEKIQLQYIKQ